jgi:hypothetical protein
VGDGAFCAPAAQRHCLGPGRETLRPGARWSQVAAGAA